MRSGFEFLAIGSTLIVIEGIGWTMDRFGMFWWTVQTIQATAVIVGFYLVIRRVDKLEKETKTLRAQIHAIRLFCARSLGFDSGEGTPGGEEGERVLRSVS